MAGFKRDSNWKGPMCMHCGKIINAEAFKDKHSIYAMDVRKRDLLEVKEEDDETSFVVKDNHIDWWVFCEECFDEVDKFINMGFIKYPRFSNKLEIEE